MAVSKLWPVRYNLGQVIRYAENRQKTDISNFQALGDVLTYAANEEKTEKQLFVEGINCNPAIARDEFILVKQQFNKTDSIQAWHGYLSFSENEVTPLQCQQLGMEFAKRAWGDRYQVVVTTHLNTQHLHCHFVVNSVSFVDGGRVRDEEKAWFKLKQIVDEICKENGLAVTEKQSNGKPYAVVAKEKAGIPTRYDYVRQSVDKALAMSKNIPELKKVLTDMGFQCNFSESRKYWTVTPSGWKKPIRLKQLGEDYTNIRITERLIENPVEVRSDQKKWYQHRKQQYKIPTRGNRILVKHSGLYRKYLYYCYRMGTLPKYSKNINEHPLLKHDSVYATKISDETRLLGKYNVSTDIQLKELQLQIQSNIEKLTKEQRHIYYQVKKRPDDILLKRKLCFVKDELNKKKKEYRLCDDIFIRSGIIDENLSVIEKEEYKEEKTR